MTPTQQSISKAIAEVGEEYAFGDDYNHAPAAMQEIAERIADIMQTKDPHFDKAKFLELCGTNDK